MDHRDEDESWKKWGTQRSRETHKMTTNESAISRADQDTRLAPQARKDEPKEE